MLWSFTGLLAQPPALRIDYFTVNDGLSTRDINDLHVGSDGFLWVGTADGLNRFDGQTFRAFNRGPGEDDRLSRGSIASISAGNEGKLIITFEDFYGYFDRFDPNDFSVDQVRLVPSTGVLGYPRAIVTDDFGRTFVVTIGEAGTTIYEHTLDYQTGEDKFEQVYRKKDDAWRSLAPRVELLPLSNGQFLLYDEEHGFRHISAQGGELLGRPFSRGPAPRRFYTFAEGADGVVYLTFRDGYPLYSWVPDANREPFPVPNLDDGLRYPVVYQDESDRLLFVATEDILGEQLPDEYYLLDTTGTFGLFEVPMPLRRPVTAIAATDFRQTVYFGLREGLGVVERHSNTVKTYLENHLDDPLFQNGIHGICGDAAGNTYFLEENGTIYRREGLVPDPTVSTPPALTLTSAPASAPRIDTLPLRYDDGDNTSVSFRAGRQLYYDSTAHALYACAQPIGLESGGLLIRHDLNTGFTETYLTSFPLQTVVSGGDGLIYLGASDPKRVGVLLAFDPETEEITTVEGFSGYRIQSLTAPDPEQVLLGTEYQGLISYNIEAGTFERLSDVETEGAEIPLNDLTVNGVTVTKNKWWIATNGGLHCYEPATGNLRHFGRHDGLSNNNIMAAVAGDSAEMWISTTNGISQLTEGETGVTFRRYYREDGLSGNAFNRYAAYRDPGGTYYFGGDNGVTTFRREDLAEQSAGAEVMITEITVYGRGNDRQIIENLSSVKQVTVHPHEKSIAFSFALPVGQRPSGSRFRVRLDDFDDDWRELLGERTVRYNNLPAGRYMLRVQAAGPNGNYGDTEKRILVHVHVRIYEKFWFQASLLLFIAGLILYNIRAKLRERLRNEQLRTQISSDIHDEVSGLLAGITLQAELLKTRTEDETMKDRLHRVGEAGRSAMSKMSDVIWSIDSRRDTIGNLLQRMQEHADEVLLPIDIRYDFTAEGFDLEKQLAGNIRQDLYFIYKEAINNTARHSNATRVRIKLNQFAQNFEMIIRDNGTPQEGQPNSKSGQGKDNMMMRAGRLKAELTMNNVAGYTLMLRMRKLG